MASCAGRNDQQDIRFGCHGRTVDDVTTYLLGDIPIPGCCIGKSSHCNGLIFNILKHMLGYVNRLYDIAHTFVAWG